MQTKRFNPKMGFWRAKQGLSKTWNLKTKIGLILGRRTKREGEGEEKRKRRSSQGMELWIFVWKLNLSMDLWNFKGFVWLIACLQKLGF